MTPDGHERTTGGDGVPGETDHGPGDFTPVLRTRQPRARAFEVVVDEIIEVIREGAFPPGSVLPSERALALRLGVGRSSVREAIRVLEHSGLLEVRTGTGIFVSEDPLSDASMLRAKTAVIGEYSPIDIAVARLCVEPEAARYAARMRQHHDLAVLKANTDEHARLIAVGADPDDVDRDFHLSLASACHNPVLTLLVNQVAPLMLQETWRRLKRRARLQPGGQERFLQQHLQILIAVQNRDEEGAVNAMTAHLHSIREGMLAELASSP